MTKLPAKTSGSLLCSLSSLTPKVSPLPLLAGLYGEMTLSWRTGDVCFKNNGENHIRQHMTQMFNKFHPGLLKEGKNPSLLKTVISLHSAFGLKQWSAGTKGLTWDPPKPLRTFSGSWIRSQLPKEICQIRKLCWICKLYLTHESTFCNQWQETVRIISIQRAPEINKPHLAALTRVIISVQHSTALGDLQLSS